MANILITGGTGFIGSHTVVSLVEAGYDVVLLDNFVNSSPHVLVQLEEILGFLPKFYEVDLLDIDSVRNVFRENKIDGVIHFAGLKAVGESVSIPLRYYSNNLVSTLNLCEVMGEFGVKNLVFSSSATVYGLHNQSPLHEELPLSTTNPYGTTKLMIEQILRDLVVADSTWKITLLRYFNPIGAHESGLIGEAPNGVPNNLMPYVTQVAKGIREKLSVFGNDYDTIDGTGVRDYIHVVDLSHGHTKAVDFILSGDFPKGEACAINLGTGTGYSVLQLVETFEAVNDIKVPYDIVDRRPGDIGTCYANPQKAAELLGWKATKSLKDMCQDAWRWENTKK